MIDFLRLARKISKLTPERSYRLLHRRLGLPLPNVQRSLGRLIARRVLTILAPGFGTRGTRWRVNLAALVTLLEQTGGPFQITEYVYVDEEESMRQKLIQEVPSALSLTAVKQEKFLVSKFAAYSRLISTKFSVQHPLFTRKRPAAAFYQRLSTTIGWVRARNKSELRAAKQLIALKLAGHRKRYEKKSGRYRTYVVVIHEYTKASSLPEIS